MRNEAEALHARISSAIAELDEVKKAGEGESDLAVQIEPQTIGVIEGGLRASLAIAEGAIGECQRAVPFSPLHPVIKPDGNTIEWCCNHNPPHCAQ